MIGARSFGPELLSAPGVGRGVPSATTVECERVAHRSEHAARPAMRPTGGRRWADPGSRVKINPVHMARKTVTDVPAPTGSAWLGDTHHGNPTANSPTWTCRRPAWTGPWTTVTADWRPATPNEVSRTAATVSEQAAPPAAGCEHEVEQRGQLRRGDNPNPPFRGPFPAADDGRPV